VEGECAGWQIEPLIKREDDLTLLEYLPDPVVDREAIDRQVRTLGDRGLGFTSISGIWQQACLVRGMAQVALDLYERPRWAYRLLSTLAEWLAEEMVAICQTTAETVFINESYLGMGMSGPLFDKYVRPFDERLVQLAKSAGKLALYHNCGRCNAVLERFADMGIDYLEPLNPRAASGDVDPADVKRRIGSKVCLRGGFNHQLMSSATPQEIQEEVRACLQTLAPGGGYILCPAGPIQSETPMENLVAFADAAKHAV
jgi:uroporphyrinogen-III decarboxylase